MKGSAVLCPTCHSEFRSRKRAGRRVFCPNCLGSARVPVVGDVAPPRRPVAKPIVIQREELDPVDDGSFPSLANPTFDRFDREPLAQHPSRLPDQPSWVSKLVGKLVMAGMVVLFCLIFSLIPDGYDGAFDDVQNGMTRAEAVETMDEQFESRPVGSSGEELVYVTEEREGTRRNRYTVIYTYTIRLENGRVVSKHRSRRSLDW